MSFAFSRGVFPAARNVGARNVRILNTMARRGIEAETAESVESAAEQTSSAPDIRSVSETQESMPVQQGFMKSLKGALEAAAANKVVKTIGEGIGEIAKDVIGPNSPTGRFIKTQIKDTAKATMCEKCREFNCIPRGGTKTKRRKSRTAKRRNIKKRNNTKRK
jgi:hypothetical protein